MSTRITSICTYLLFVFSTAVFVSSSNADELKLTGEKVVIFKDGHCLVVKRGTGKTDANGTISTFEVPDAAILGSFWAVPREGRIVSMTAGWAETEETSQEEMPCTETIEIIKANEGKQCSLVLNDKTRLDGTIRHVLTKESAAAPHPHQTAGLRNSIHYAVSGIRHNPVADPQPPTEITISQFSGDKFLLKTESGDVLIHAGNVHQLVIEDMKITLNRTVTRKTKRKRLQFRFDAKDSEVEILLMYFRPGVRWIPTYRLDLENEFTTETAEDAEQKMARLDLQGEIVNEAEDIIDTPVDLVVGVPNFRFRSIPSPLTLERVMRNALLQAAPNLMGQGSSFGNQMMSNALYTQRSSEVNHSNQGGASGSGGQADLPEELTTAGGHDLFVYHLDKITLKRGERSTVPVLTAQVPYRDLHTWDIHVKQHDSPNTDSSPLVLSTNKVWRQVELINNTEFPLTTGAVMIVDGYQPLAQELLTYTPSGHPCRIPVTVAVDTRGKVEDFETGREERSYTIAGRSYTKVNGQIDVELANYKRHAIDVEVRLSFGGRANEASDDGQIRLNHFRQSDWYSYRGDHSANNSSVVTWKTSIEAGKKFEPTVKFHYFSRR